MPSSSPPDDRKFRFDESNAFLLRLVEMLRRHPKRVVFPEANDIRILRVAAELVRLECVSPILLGRRKLIESLAATEGIPMDFIGVVEPEESSDFQAYCERYRRSQRLRHRVIRTPAEIIAKPHYFAAMMMQYGAADAVVGGNTIIPAAFFRALLQIIKRQDHLDSASSCMPMRLPHHPDLGHDGMLFLADCAVIPSPTVGQLANIAVETAKVAGPLLQERARVAMLSFSTKGSARTTSTHKILAATEMARLRASQQRIPMEIDGEMQLDAALVPSVAERKCPQGTVAGKANILVFPDLNAAHIAYKILHHIAGAECYGQMVLGLTRPASQVSRVADEITIFGAAICAAYLSISYREMVQQESWDE